MFQISIYQIENNRSTFCLGGEWQLMPHTHESILNFYKSISGDEKGIKNGDEMSINRGGEVVW